MPLADYAHWNEDAEYMWWHEEGKHMDEPPEPDDDWGPGWDDDYECTDAPRECLEAGNFNRREDDGSWECASCGFGPFEEEDGKFMFEGLTKEDLRR